MKKKKQKEEGVLPPANLEAEQAVIGAMLLRPQAINQVADILGPQDFYRQAHSLIYRAIMDLYSKGKPVDLTSVTSLLHDRGELKEVGGAVFLASLSEHVGTAANAPYYAQLVREKAILRGLLERSKEIIAACLGQVEDIDEFLDWAEKSIFEGIENKSGANVKQLGELDGEKYNQLSKIFYEEKEYTGILSGFYDLDRLTNGFHPGELTIIAARPSMGKTAIITNIAYNAGQKDVPVVVFSLEMTALQMVLRFISSAGRINGDNLRRAKLGQHEWVVFSDLHEKFCSLPIYIDDTPSISPLEIRARSRRLYAQKKANLIVVDYLQLMKTKGKRNREEEISHIAWSLKSLAKELNVTVIAVSQVNREIEKRPGQKYFLSDLRESGALEQHADNVIFLYLEEEAAIAEIDVKK